MAKVSVIVPNYNHAAFLGQRIDSILAQSYQDFELIILDDCSTDNSKEVILSYANHPKISHIVINEKNSGGPFYQWERGINLAKGDYVWMAESDDWCEPSLLQELVEGIEKDRDCVISYCQMLYVLNENEVKWQSSHHHLSEIIDSENFIKDYLAIKVAIYNASMAIFKRSAFKNLSNEFTSFKLSGDRLFWIQIAQQGKTHISGKVLNYFRKHDKDVSGKAYSSGVNFIEELRVIDYMHSSNLIDNKLHSLAIKRQLKNYWKVKNKIDPENNKIIKSLFLNLKPNKFQLIKSLPSAIWGALKNDK